MTWTSRLARSWARFSPHGDRSPIHVRARPDVSRPIRGRPARSRKFVASKYIALILAVADDGRVSSTGNEWARRSNDYRLIPEPEKPPFLRQLHAIVDAVAAKHDALISVAHSYQGEETSNWAVHGWNTRVVRASGAPDVIDIWYDALDDDVIAWGYCPWHEWFPAAGETEKRACLSEVEQLLDDFAHDRLAQDPGPRQRRATNLAFVILAAGAIGVAVGRRFR